MKKLMFLVSIVGMFMLMGATCAEAQIVFRGTLEGMGAARAEVQLGPVEEALVEAVKNNDLPKVQELFERKDLNVNVTGLGNGGWSLFHLVVRRGNEEIIKEFLKREDLDVNVTTETGGNTALHLAVFYRNVNVVQELLKRKDLKLDRENKEGQTAIDVANAEKIWYDGLGKPSDYGQKIGMIKAESFARTLKEENFIKEMLKREISYSRR